MAKFDDESSDTTEPLPDAVVRRRMKPLGPVWPYVVTVLGAGGVLAAWLLWDSGTKSTQLGPGSAAAADASLSQPMASLPPSTETDELIKKLLSALSSDPTLAKWLGAQDLVRRFVAGVASIADGKSPRASFGFLAPEGRYQVVEHWAKIKRLTRVQRKKVAARKAAAAAAEKPQSIEVDAGTYRRYDPLAKIVGSLDVARVAEVYRQLKPLCDAAYSEIGPPASRFNTVLGRALDRVIEARLPEGKVQLAFSGAVYKYIDDQLEALSPVEKHLLRMGPQNASIIQAKLRDLKPALLAEGPGPDR
jgi:hypothetical protein